MANWAHFIGLAAFAIGAPAAALAQPSTPPHQHGQPAAGPRPAQANQQHQDHAAGQQDGRHQADCECCCCRMMMQMMQRHGQPGAMQHMNMMRGHGNQLPGAQLEQGEEHRRHQGERPN